MSGRRRRTSFSLQRIFLVSNHPSADTNSDHEKSNSSTCLLFAPAEYFESSATKLQLARTLSSSFRINSYGITANEPTDEPSAQAQTSPTSSQQPTVPSTETTTPLVYILCVPVSCELESEWRGVTHHLPMNKTITSIHPLHVNWKSTTIFLLTQQTQDLGTLEKSFKERLSKTNVQQTDLYDFETKPDQLLRKRSCFEEVDREMNTLAHTIMSLSHSVANNVETFERVIDKSNSKSYVVSVRSDSDCQHCRLSDLAYGRTGVCLRHGSDSRSGFLRYSIRSQCIAEPCRTATLLCEYLAELCA